MGQHDTTANLAGSQQFLTFSLSGEMFGVGILTVKEIIEYGSVTEIPMVPAFICGVINLRGAVVPVIDLASRFGGKRSEISRRTCIVIIELSENDERQDVGVVVDAVSEVLEIPASEIEPPPSSATSITAEVPSVRTEVRTVVPGGVCVRALASRFKKPSKALASAATAARTPSGSLLSPPAHRKAQPG